VKLTPKIHALCLTIDQRYTSLLPTLPSWRGHCNEVANIALTAAAEQGVPAQLVRKWAVQSNGNRVQHWGVRLDGAVVLHSPYPGQIEVTDEW
jgi:hypothetical protein